MERRLFFLLNLAQRKLLRYADATCRAETGLSVAQAALLFELARDPRPQSELVEALPVRKAAVTGLLARMEENGLVVRRRDPADGRAWLVEATDAGRERLPKLRRLLKRFNRALQGDFNDEELDTVIRFLNHIVTWTDQQEPSASRKEHRDAAHL
ncbi:MAG: MarR family transcriptional regulator [Candidatus Dadabacteria bacterium]|nr:MAG: MarR family transcriptional regulator [Candidatus Dadabacteria bacterium]